jgi:hypothetical protein
VTGIRARPVRRGQQRRGTRITFTLTAPARVVFVVRGPAPSCDVVGRFAVRGDRGVNNVRFTGRIGRRTLQRGTYRITARTHGRAPSRPIAVRVGGQQRRGAFTCAAPQTGPNEDFTAIVGTFSNGENAPTAGPEAAPPAKPAESKDDDGGGGVLPAVSDRLKDALPSPRIPEATTSPARILGLGALLLLIVSGLALVVYFVRYFRRLAT